MSVKPEIQTSGGAFDAVKLVVAALLLIGGVGAFYYFGDQPDIYRWLGLLALAGIAFGVAYATPQGKSAWSFLQTSRIEVRKMVWPSRQETVQTTLAVLAVVVILGLMMWVLDIGLFAATQALTGQGG